MEIKEDGGTGGGGGTIGVTGDVSRGREREKSSNRVNYEALPNTEAFNLFHSFVNHVSPSGRDVNQLG